DWNSSGYILDWNLSGMIVNWSEVIGDGGNTSWNESYARSLFVLISDLLWGNITGRPTHLTNFTNDLNALDESIGAAMKAWDAILSDAKTGLSVIHNIQHGLGLQRLKVKLFILIDTITRAFEQDGLPGLNDFKQFSSSTDALAKEFQLAKYKTRELYEQLMYDSEVTCELEIRFEKPREILDGMGAFLRKLDVTLQQAGEAMRIISEDDGFFNETRINDELKDIMSKIEAGFGDMKQGRRVPLDIGLLETFTGKITPVLPSLDKEKRNMLDAIVKPIKIIHETIDEFMFGISVKRLQPGNVNRF
nr:hypothetical protein [Candidatus Sigynarchaeota archaeon]